ncbi:MAG TPA: PaaI family thioesterase [Solirubrobacteraceae bacterium]|jgi:1,4-dihydroxy-2-naphthoyl-CoA hydrolase|nr:PaaI family thioesterase [Solirubrobacteraceae bacterium]
MTLPEFERTLDGVIACELLELSAERVRARVRVHDAIRQRFGVVHGGAYCAWAEMLASEATVVGVAAEDKIAMGMSNSTQFLRAATDGMIMAEGRVRRRGRTVWVWDIDFTDERGALCAISRVTLAVRPAPEGGPRPLTPRPAEPAR